jgi:1-phosphofructokinase
MHAVLEGGVEVLKTSDEDLEADGLLESDADEDAVIDVMEALSKQGEGARHVLVTRGHRPALSLTEGTVLAARGPRFEPVDTSGAGDSTTAGVAAAMGQGQTFAEALRLGVAAAVLNVARHGLASGHPEAIAALVDKVEIRDVRGAS